jgi:hypothetical protein
MDGVCAFRESGTYVVVGALQPVKIDVRRNTGRYEEANVWMKHPIHDLPTATREEKGKDEKNLRLGRPRA